jgi:p24 family protein beta-1
MAALILDILLVLASFLAISNAHNIQMKAHSRECFHESLHKDDKMTVTFQVGDREFGGSGNLDIDFWVRRCSMPAYAYASVTTQRAHCIAGAHGGAGILTKALTQIQDPSGNYQTQQRTVSSGDHSFDAHQDGKYTYCFSNEHWSANTKEVSFNVHGIVYVPEAEAPTDPLEKEGAFRHSKARRCTASQKG